MSAGTKVVGASEGELNRVESDRRSKAAGTARANFRTFLTESATLAGGGIVDGSMYWARKAGTAEKTAERAAAEAKMLDRIAGTRSTLAPVAGNVGRFGAYKDAMGIVKALPASERMGWNPRIVSMLADGNVRETLAALRAAVAAHRESVAAEKDAAEAAPVESLNRAATKGERKGRKAGPARPAAVIPVAGVPAGTV